MTRLSRVVMALATGAIPVALLYAYSADGPEAGNSGAPGETDCTSCHGGTANSHGGSITAVFSSGSTYVPGGLPIEITVNVTDASNPSHGFQMSSRTVDNTQAGRFDPKQGFPGLLVLCENDNLRQGICPGGAPREFIEHNAPRTGTWTFLWTPPATNIGPVTFYLAGNAVDGNGNEFGDYVYTKTYTLTPQGTVTVTPENALILAQFVGGGTEWHTTLFITNLSTAQEGFTLNFYDDNGQPKGMPMLDLGTVNTITGTLAPLETRRFETGPFGTLQVAWGLLIPASPTAQRLSGLAVFRQTVPSGQGTVSSEAVVDFVAATDTKYVQLYDNQLGFATTTMLANPDVLNPISILVDIRDQAGAVLATDTINLPALGHTAFVLADRFPSVVNKRGSVRFAATPKGFVGLGLRFSPFQTFTSFRMLTSKDAQ